jgi:hypothetical protein
MIANEALMILENELVMANKVHRAHEKEFAQTPNGYKKGDTITIMRPTDFTVRDGAVADVQDVTEGSTSLVVDKRKGIDFKFSSQELTQDINRLSERVIKPAMIQLANQVDTDLMALYKDVPNWVGTPGGVIDSFADFAKAPERLDEYAVMQEGRCGVLSPADHWGLVGSQTTLYDTTILKPAYRKGETGYVGGVDLYMSQNVPTHTVGSDVTTVTVNQSVTTSTIAYSDVKDSMQQTITIAGGNLNPGDVFTIADVYAVNPVTKAALPFKKQFTVVSYSSNTLVLYPAMIWSGPFQNVSVTSGVSDLNTKAIVAVGTASTSYRQNMVFHKNAFALAMVPLEIPPSKQAVSSRQSKNGISVRVIPYYDGTNDVENWRLDILYGTKAIDPRLATRLSAPSS